ncbi:MAG TPA: chemotaxis protein CheW [Gemmatimonadales bacterium]|nr:chemotaxis protein CheW [Gemmatimonadales bacterium]
MTDVTALRVLRCRSGGLEWALADNTVREVAAMVPLARIPGAAAAVLGLGNLRGTMVTVVDTRRLLGQAADGPPVAVVVVEAGGRRVGLAVDEVDDLHQVPMDAFELAQGAPGVPDGVIISRGRIDRPFLLLDPEALLAPLFPAADRA